LAVHPFKSLCLITARGNDQGIQLPRDQLTYFARFQFRIFF
jgi:hypothetical protein